MNPARYRLYREHKYLFYVFSQLLQLVATANLSLRESLTNVKNEFKKLEHLLSAHADYEEVRIHSILKKHHSEIYLEAEIQHQNHHNFFEKIEKDLEMIEKKSSHDIHFLSYQLYLDLRNFISDNLAHFDYEERVIMPEVQRFASDDEIREVDRMSYRLMTPDQMVHMMQVLFPHMNYEDKITFLSEIKDCEPQKFEHAWDGISPSIESNERLELIKLLKI